MYFLKNGITPYTGKSILQKYSTQGEWQYLLGNATNILLKIYILSLLCIIIINRIYIFFLSKIKSYTVSLQDGNMYKPYIWMNINSKYYNGVTDILVTLQKTNGF